MYWLNNFEKTTTIHPTPITIAFISIKLQNIILIGY
jgi:hypothetical protein